MQSQEFQMFCPQLASVVGSVFVICQMRESVFIANRTSVEAAQKDAEKLIKSVDVVAVWVASVDERGALVGGPAVVGKVS